MSDPDPLSSCGECLLFGAIQGLGDGLVLVDARERIFHLNRRARQLLELGPAPLTGRLVRPCLKPSGLEGFWIEAVAQEAPATTELTLPSGVLIRASVSLCLSTKEEPIGRALLIRDVTTERRLQIELSASIAERLAKMAGPAPGPGDFAALTAREREVLAHLAAGLTNAQIASRLCVSANTVASHLKSLYAKIQVSGRAEAAAWATARGLRPPTR